MIFVTVGTQLSFDRLVRSVDSWAGGHCEVDVFAQIGPSSYSPRNIRWAATVSPLDADGFFRSASLVVAHAGMGSILTALRYKKPILVLPRRADLGEHRNDHQLATAKWLSNRAGLTVAWNEEELLGYLSNSDALSSGEAISDYATDELIFKLKSFISSS